MSNGPGAAVVVWVTLVGIGLAPAQQPPLTNAEYDALSAVVGGLTVAGLVCDVGLLPSSPNRPETIVAVVDFSGRLFCNTVVRVSRTAPPVLLQEISGWWVASLSPGALEVIQDIDGDGEVELVVPTAISDYEETRACIATLPLVYRCDATRCVDISSDVPEFYRGWRALVTARLGELEASSDEDERGSVPCLAMASDKADRLSGGDVMAGVGVADEWMRIPDPFLQRKAVWILSDIYVETGDPGVRRRLETLAQGGHDYARIMSWLEQRKRERER